MSLGNLHWGNRTSVWASSAIFTQKNRAPNRFRKLDLHDSLKGKHQTIQNSNDAIKSFVKKLSGRKGKSLVVMEATGGYEQPLVDALHDAQIDVAVCNPLQVRSFAKGIGILEKNDPIDAAMIARFADVVRPKLREKPTQSQRKLKALVHRRGQILSQQSAERNRLAQTRDPDMQEIIEQAITFYKNQLKVIDQKIAQTIQDCPLMQRKSEHL